MHSSVFDSLKGVKEVIGDNYTSSQLLGSLDILIFNAVDSIIEHTDWMDIVIGRILLWYGDNKKRKLSPIPKEEFMELCFLFLCSDPEGKMRIIRRMEMERNVWMSSCKMFASAPIDCNPLNSNRVFYKERCGKDLWVAVRDVSYWLGKAHEMKSRIMEKYLRFTLTMANSYYKNSHTSIDLDDLIQNFTLAVSKAIDKCSVNQGTLTSYIQQWMRSAQNSSASGHEYGIAYSVPQASRKSFLDGRSPNIYVPIDDEEVLMVASIDTSVEDQSQLNHIRLLAKHADPRGFARLQLGIQEIVN